VKLIPHDRKEVFQFKQFSVRHAKSTMKVGTDGVLLGAWVKNEGEKRVLDVGTGSGVIALMLAQRFSEASILAIDIDRDSADEASENFMKSPWAQRLAARHISLQQLARGKEFFDLIVSNPPYFNNGTRSPHTARHRARHRLALDHAELVGLSSRLLEPEGKLVVIIPELSYKEFLAHIRENGLREQKVLHFRPKSSKAVERIIIQAGRGEVTLAENELIQYDDMGNWSAHYKALTRDYYLRL